MKEYALYKGDEILAMGTAKEIADKLGVKEQTIKYYGRPIYQKRARGTNARRLVLLDEQKEELAEDREKCFADKGNSCIALKQKDCYDCNFFQTQEQLDESVKNSQKRLEMLGRVGAKQIGEIAVAVLEKEPQLYYYEAIEKAKEIYKGV